MSDEVVYALAKRFYEGLPASVEFDVTWDESGIGVRERLLSEAHTFARWAFILGLTDESLRALAANRGVVAPVDGMIEGIDVGWQPMKRDRWAVRIQFDSEETASAFAGAVASGPPEWRGKPTGDDGD